MPHFGLFIHVGYFISHWMSRNLPANSSVLTMVQGNTVATLVAMAG